MNLQDVRDLLDYHYWARDRVLEAAAALPQEQLTRDLGSSFKSIRDTLAHIYAAEWAWCSRWHGESPSALLSPDGFPDVATIRTKWSELEGTVRAFVGGLGEEGLGRVFHYTM